MHVAKLGPRLVAVPETTFSPYISRALYTTKRPFGCFLNLGPFD